MMGTDALEACRAVVRVLRDYATMADTLTAAQASGSAWRDRAMAAERELAELRASALEELRHAHARAVKAERGPAAVSAPSSRRRGKPMCGATRRGRPCNGTPQAGGDGRCWWCARAPAAPEP